MIERLVRAPKYLPSYLLRDDSAGDTFHVLLGFGGPIAHWT